MNLMDFAKFNKLFILLLYLYKVNELNSGTKVHLEGHEWPAEIIAVISQPIPERRFT